MPQQFDKDPNATLDYTINWSSWLAAGETISTSTWTVPAGLTKVSDTKTTNTTTIWLSEGTLYERYQVVNRIVTSANRTEDRTLYLLVVNR